MHPAVARARACLGTRFRLHGRSRAHGLDCVGLVALAYDVAAPGGYALRGGDPAGIAATLAAAGFVAIGEATVGDLLLVLAGPFQHHLAILTDDGFVHADAGLRRVVEVPGRPRWPISSAWRKD